MCELCDQMELIEKYYHRLIHLQLSDHRAYTLSADCQKDRQRFYNHLDATPSGWSLLVDVKWAIYVFDVLKRKEGSSQKAQDHTRFFDEDGMRCAKEDARQAVILANEDTAWVLQQIPSIIASFPLATDTV